MAKQNSFQSAKGSFSDTDALACMDKWVERKTSLLLQQQLQIFNLFSWHGRYGSSKAHEANHSSGLQNGLEAASGLVGVYECVSGKKWNGYYLLAVTPLVLLRQQWKERLEPFSKKLRDNFLFKPVPGFNGKPLRRIILFIRNWQGLGFWKKCRSSVAIAAAR